MQRTRVFSARMLVVLCLIASGVFAVGCAATGEARSERSGSASIVEDIEPTVPLAEQVARVAGVYLNENRELRIRGSLGPPLVVVDGIRMGNRGDLSFLSPYDVSSIEVVKGPQTSYYGMGGRDGVILVSTKRGGDEDE
jgi:outer membrane receptor for ferrienterochelin and colicin